MNERELARVYASSRTVVGVLMLLFPGWLLRDFLGPSTRRTRAVGRMLGVREVVLGAGTLVAEREEKVPLRPWMTYAAVSDAVDALGMLFAYRQLPKRKRFLFLLMSLNGAATGAWLMSRIDD